MTAPPAPGEKSRNRSSWPRIAVDIRLERVAVEQVALGRAPGRVADHPGPAADQCDRPAAEPLEPQQAEDRDEVADVERVARRIEPVVAGDRRAGRRAAPPGRASWRAGCPATRARPAGPSRCQVPAARHRHDAEVVSTREAARERSFTAPMLSCGQMQTSLARRQRHRRALVADPKGAAAAGSAASSSPSRSSSSCSP